MSKRRRGLERFLHQFDKDKGLQARMTADPDAVAAEFGISAEELAALKNDDMVKIFEWGVHPLLVRNYAGFRRLDYYGMLRARGY